MLMQFEQALSRQFEIFTVLLSRVSRNAKGFSL
jgi:hypothetical protein